MKYTTGIVGMINLRGSGGDTTASKNHYSSYVKKKPIPIQPHTIPQQAVKGFLISASQFWGSLTQAQQNTWLSARLSFPRTDTLGQDYTMTGHALEVSCNVDRQLLGLSLLTDAPLPVSIPSFVFADVAMSASAANMTFDFGNSPIGSAGNALILRATRQLSNGRNAVFQNDFRELVTSISGPFTAPFTIPTSVYTNRFGTLTAGRKVFWRWQLWDTATGLQGAIMESVSIIAP